MSSITYHAHRDLLAVLRAGFLSVAESPLALFHQMVFAPEQLSTEQWQAFIDANSAPDCPWQKWSLAANGHWCGRFFDGENKYDQFIELAETGYRLLLDIQSLIESGHSLPEGAHFQVPRNPGHQGWLEHVYDTHQWYSSVRSGNWNRSGQFRDTDTYSLIESPTGMMIPAHPFYLELEEDVFVSSALSIEWWLDPPDFTGDEIALPPICLPPMDQANDVSETPVAPPVSESKAVTETRDTPEGRSPRRTKPVYDTDLRELRVGTTVQKRFNQPAANQERILMAFQCSRWRVRIDDPLPNGPDAERLRDTIDALNTPQKGKPTLIRFGGDGTGKGIVWRWNEESNPS